MRKSFHWLFAVLFLVTGCRYRCVLDPVENFTWESEVEITVTHEVYGDFHFLFLYQDRAVQEARWWTEEDLAQEVLDTIDYYVNDLGRRFDPDDENRYWTIFISREDETDPLWTDICAPREYGIPAACSCTDGALYPPVQTTSENQFGLSGRYFWWMAHIQMCHETLHSLRNHDLLDPDKNHDDTVMWARCPP